MKNRMTSQTLEKTREEDDTFSDPKRLEYQLTAPWNLLGSTAIEQDTPVSNIDLKLKGKAWKFGISDQLLCMKILEEHLGRKYSQLFWGLPSLHSESIVATILIPLNNYSLDSRIVLFNGICKAAEAPILGQGSPALPQPRAFCLTFIRPQPQTLLLPETQPQAQMQSLLSPVPPLSLPRGTLQTPQTRTVCDVVSGDRCLHYPLLQNHQDSLWGLVPEGQQHETPFGLLVPRFPLVSQHPQTYVSVPGTGQLHVRNTLEDNLKPYRPSSLMPPWCSQPRSGAGRLEGTDLQSKPTGASSHSCKCTKPRRSVHWGHSSDLRTGELSRSESVCEGISTRPQLRNDVARNLGHILGKCPLDSPQMISGYYALDSLRDDVPETERNRVSHSRTALGNEVRISRRNLDQRQTKRALRLHMSRKMWQIAVGRIPIKVCCSWLAEDVPLRNSLLGKIYCNTATPQISFLDHKTYKMLETHLIRFQMSQKWGLPLKVIESIKSYTSREDKTWPLPLSDFPSLSKSISGMDLKGNFPHPLGGSSDASCADRMETGKSASITDPPPLLISHVYREGEESLRQSHFSICCGVTENVQTAEGDSPSNLDVSRNDAVLQTRPRQEQPIKDMAGSESENEIASSSLPNITVGTHMPEKNPTPELTPTMIIEKILEARVLGACLSESDSSNKLESFTKESKHRNSLVSVLATEHDPPRTPAADTLMASDFEKHLFRKLRSLTETESQNQTEGSESDTSFISESFTIYSSSSSNSVSSAHLCSDLWQEPRVFKPMLKNSQSAEKRLTSPMFSKENRSDTPGSRTHKAVMMSQPIKGKPDKKARPPETYFRKKIGQFVEWLYPSKDSTRYRSEKDKALLMSCGPPEAHELMMALGKILEDKLLCGQKSEFLEWKQKKSLQAHPEPIKGQSSVGEAAYAQQGKTQTTCFCPQTAISPGSSPEQQHHVSFGRQPQFWCYSTSPDTRDP